MVNLVLRDRNLCKNFQNVSNKEQLVNSNSSEFNFLNCFRLLDILLNVESIFSIFVFYFIQIKKSRGLVIQALVFSFLAKR